MTSPSMVHRSGDSFVVRSVVSGDALYQDQLHDDEEDDVVEQVDEGTMPANEVDEDELDLPQCKIKRNYTCTHCDYFSQNPRSYLYHLRDIHKQKIRVYECPSCLYASKHSQKLQRHVHMVHVMNKRGKQKMKSKKAKQAPVMVTIPFEVTTSTSASDVRDDNQFDAKMPDSALSVGAGELLTCSICGFGTRNVNAMGRHEKLVHLKKRFFRCNKCNYVTHMRARYTKHVKYHSMPMIKCDLCDFRTPYKWNLDRHYKNHQGDGAYKCSLCNFTADIKQSLTVHEMNHHVPPVGQVSGAGAGRRRNKVGASDSMAQENEIDQEELELLRMERENDEDVDNGAPRNGYYQMSAFDINSISTNSNRQTVVKVGNSRGVTSETVTSNKLPKVKIKKLKDMKALPSQEQNLLRNFPADFIHPDDIVSHKNGKVYIKNIKCRICNYKAAWDGEMARHELKVHNIQRPLTVKKVPRPIPNLIPIQNKTATSPPPANSLPILRIPSVRSRAGPSILKQAITEQPDVSLSEKDLNDICAKSCPNSSLKDFASLMGGDSFNILSEARIKVEPKSDDETLSSPASPDLKASAASPPNSTTFKKKNASFFDKLKEKLMVGTGESCNLTCWCGQETKCLSELMRHQKLHSENTNSSNQSVKHIGETILTSGAELSSTRCQHCRQRCKTSSDLVNHLQSCSEANKALNLSHSSLEESIEDIDNDEKEIRIESDPEQEDEIKIDEVHGPHPMENKVFVWNNMPQPQEAECEEECLQQMPPDALANEDDSMDASVRSDGSLVGIETAPGYGAVTSNIGSDAFNNQADGKPVKKVFKCPHCTFWASTASRFHVHIVGHLNKKPFECSLCSYRSNWRWDITKHIRLKSARDVNHEAAGVLMTDETGRRNYSKYNKYLTLMRVHEPSAESSGSGRRTKGVEATQGNQQQFPSPPQLTRAPSPNTANTARPAGSAPLRPPPPLRAANILFPGVQLQTKPKKETKRPSRGIFDQGPPSKRPSIEGKKTLWKCKKCNFRDARRELVLAHVKEHYQQREMQQTAASADSDAGERHCRLKHSGDVKVVRGTGSRVVIEDSTVEETSESTYSDGTKRCEICPFTSLSSNEMAIHKEHHSSWPGATYKCKFCLYFVSLKKDLISHLKLHGLTDPEDLFKTIQGKSPLNQSSSAEESEEVSLIQQNNADQSPTKRYKCIGCPYVSNSKSQFLYHKQFHRPRGAPFKCGLCSYNVSRRHLLHQHLRVHGIVIPPQKSPSKHQGGFTILEEGADEIEEVTVMSPQSQEVRNSPDLDTQGMSDIPLVWVSRGTKFFKMYKCRFCPHVNVRKANIHEHEKMHSSRTRNEVTLVEIKQEPGTQSNVAASPQQHHCPDCNYICNNAGVLSSHAKVHQGMYGHVHCLVDGTRSDEAQLQDLNATNDNVEIIGDDETEDIDMNDSQEEVNQENCQQATPMETPIKDNSTPMSSTNTNTLQTEVKEAKIMFFCVHCPARFLLEKELSIHIRFHEIRLSYQCESCSYTARQQPHLLAHIKVHSDNYQDRTNEMSQLYQTSPQHPRPRTAVIVEGAGANGPVWVVIGGRTHQPDEELTNNSNTSKVPTKHFSCNLCPANFFKNIALQYHMTLHGGSGLHRCRYCDYAVKTFGNLVKHEMIHGNDAPLRTIKAKTHAPVSMVPISGTDLFQHKTDVQKNDSVIPRNNYQLNSYNNSPSNQLHVDPQFGILMHGNPEYVYPTYFKNGRLKEKRYKCHKCPSAFEKREQYKVHLSLHGSKQRYKCEKCDYSVKYYANYIQHMRKHQINDEAMVTRKSDSLQKELDASEQDAEETTQSDDVMEDDVEVINVQSPRATKSLSSTPAGSNNGPLQLSVADRQSLMLLQMKRTTAAGNSPEPEENKKTYYCPHCPYSSLRKDGVESHVKRHEAVSGIRGAFVCDYCDYSVPQQHFLREHNKVHFSASFKKQPEAFMKCSRMELWVQNQGKENITGDLDIKTLEDIPPTEKSIVFKDSGHTDADNERFYPPLPEADFDSDGSDEEKVYVNALTGEPMDEEALQEHDAQILETKSSVPDLDKPFVETNEVKESSDTETETLFTDKTELVSDSDSSDSIINVTDVSPETKK